MLTATVILLIAAALSGVPSLLPTRHLPRPRLLYLAGAVQLGLLAGATLCALIAEPQPDTAPRALIVAAATVAAALGGSGVASAVLRTASTPQQPDSADVLRGGTWIGVLERTAAAATLLAAWPQGLAVVLAVKGLARYSELKSTAGAAERFIIGTFCSVLWAAACAGIAVVAAG